MSLSSIELWQRISSAGLAAPMICRSWAAEALQGLQPSDAADSTKILEQLVRLGRLTEYQAELIAGKRRGEFKKGAWTLLRPVQIPLWEGWFEAVKSPNEPPTWLRWINSDELTELQSATPSLPRGLRLAQLKGPNLQSVQIPELIDKQLQLQVQPIQGLPLTIAIQQNERLRGKSGEIVRCIAEGLKPLHAAGLAHGRVLPDRVYWHAEANDGNRVTLARDPICCHTASLDTKAIGTIQNGLNGLSPAQFMAPEFLAPGQLPTPSSDIYSLGCLWWWMVTGKPLVVGSTLDKQLARQAEASIALPKDCSLPPPMVRCLQHCLAKNLPARFPTAQELCQALDAASAAVAKGLVPKVSVAKKQEDTKPVSPPEKRAATNEPKQNAAPNPESAVVAAQPKAQPKQLPSITKPQPAAAKAGPTKSNPVRPVASKPGMRKKVKRKPANKWALPITGGLAGVCALLGILIFSGVFKSSGRKASPKPTDVSQSGANNAMESGDSKTTSVEETPQDPRLSVYRIVQSGKDLLWAPPAAPKPIALDLLPPGGQIFLTIRPKQLLNTPTGKSLLAAYNDDVSPSLEQINKRAGVTFDSIERVTVAFYAENEVPVTCMRVQLEKPTPLSTLKAGWGSVSNEKVGEVTLLSNAAGESYYIAQQPLSDAQSVNEFAFGPTTLMKEAAELQGGAGPLGSQLGKLWQASDTDADFSVLLTSSFLFSEGKTILANMPKRMGNRLRELLEVDSRAALIQTRFEPTWYVEVQLLGLSEREAPRLSELLRQRIVGASNAVEEWFISEQPHPYWRPLAIRFPQMLRTLAEQSRFGVEGGAAIANAYLPSEAATNILLSTWIASQDGATLASDAPPETVAATPAAKPLSMDEYLSRKIKLSFDQEPIESALRLVGEEANANLPAGTPQLRFALDGGAFERAGITRNQQLRDFKHVDLPMRDALTAIAKRGNPVTTVKDTHEVDQRLIWVIRDDPENAGKHMVSLTTRAEATAKKLPLPTEFAPVK